jgi:hypothetical protein
MKVENQKTPRHREKYAALNFKRQVKLRMDAFDGIEEYVDKLTDKEKDWLNRFLEETVVTNFQHKGTLLYKGKKKRRECYGENNARNRCQFTRAKAAGLLISVENANMLTNLMDAAELQSAAMDEEDKMLARIAAKRSGITEED